METMLRSSFLSFIFQQGKAYHRYLTSVTTNNQLFSTVTTRCFQLQEIGTGERGEEASPAGRSSPTSGAIQRRGTGQTGSDGKNWVRRDKSTGNAWKLTSQDAQYVSFPVVFQLNFPYLAGGPDFRPLLGWFKDPGDLDTICGWVSGKRFKIPHIFVVTSRVSCKSSKSKSIMQRS